MNPQETQQVIAHDEKWVPSIERVKISSTNVRLETTVNQKEETFHVIIDVIKNSMCFKTFTITVEVLEIFMQQFWYTIKKVKNSLRTLAAVINKCLFGKTTSNDRHRKSRIDILWGTFYKENVDYPELIWEDFAFQIDHKKERKSRCKTMPFPRFTKVIINNFLSQHKSLSNLKFQHYHTIKDDGIIPPKKSKGKDSHGKKTTGTLVADVDVSEESDSETARKRTASRRMVKKKVINFATDNMIPDPDVALELGKSIRLTKAT
ncbi:hypothetical protein Tco_1461577 [Tanacetum coccineum]